MNVPESLIELVEHFHRLPGIGRKSANRMAYSLLQENKLILTQFSESLLRVHDEIHPCPQCFSFTDLDLCPICSNPRREGITLCVVEKQSDIAAFEKGGHYKGQYHVLGGALSPLDGIGPRELNIPHLLHRIEQFGTKEVILATSASADGESTANFIDHALAETDVVRTRLARGIPVGTDLEYLDELTLSRALEARVTL